MVRPVHESVFRSVGVVLLNEMIVQMKGGRKHASLHPAGFQASEVRLGETRVAVGKYCQIRQKAIAFHRTGAQPVSHLQAGRPSACQVARSGAVAGSVPVCFLARGQPYAIWYGHWAARATNHRRRTERICSSPEAF
ncbi:hypothetical protein ZHAS_00010908 [Anopheles sinensis]|uniref:Uncharacterized protein n=1 Tax=Anopheles sinensis TaxID=74873 RepID=A0A084VYU3_ANOSI|nr:hypothetical protein ZHAS_00010908 [Anopheles sinensis]